MSAISGLAAPTRAVRVAVRPRVPYIVAFSAAALGAGMGRAITTSYLPVLLERIRDAPGLIGTIMLVNAAAGLAVPLVVGVWSDRVRAREGGRRMPFIVGGTVLTAGGLAAVALGSSSSYLALALAGAVVYVGLNAVTTAHRALVPETFPMSGRPRATSAQELALLVGGLLGIAAGGALTSLAGWAPFALAAAVVPVLALPTVLRTTEPDQIEQAEEAEQRPVGYYVRAARRPGVRGFLAAQILWVLGYAALPAFFLLYAERELSLEPSIASLLLATFGIVTAGAIVAAGRVGNPARHKPLLVLGVALMGAGFLAVAASSGLATVGPALLAGAVGFGLISTLGFPLFSGLIPEGEAGGYTALYFSVRAIASAIALPAAGWIIAATGSYRALFVLGGAATLAALVPLAGVGAACGADRQEGRAKPAPPSETTGRHLSSHRQTPLGARGRLVLRWGVALTALFAATLGTGLVFAHTGLHRADEWLFRRVNELGPGPDVLWQLLDPHTRNYVTLIGVGVAAAAVSSLRSVSGVFARLMASALLAWGLLEGMYQLYDRDRPEEVFGPAAITLNGHTWARLESFPSGHMAITAALAVAIALAFPRLRTPLWIYAGAVAFTRVLFGAHFPLDSVAGIAIGAGSALAVFAVSGYPRAAATSRGAAQASESPIAIPSTVPASTSSQ